MRPFALLRVYANAIQTIDYWDDVQNNPIKIIFICEFITGGGLNHSDLPYDLAVQGELMRDALLSDLSLLGYRVRTTVDARLISPLHCESCRIVNAQDDPWQIWADEMQQADAVWVIAPETDGYLQRMTTLASTYHKTIIGSGLAAVKAFTSKHHTYQLLQQSAIKTVPTYLYERWAGRDWPKEQSTHWLAKPNDGAGCAETVCFADAEGLRHWIIQNNKQKTHIIQPFLEGVSASIACVVHQGKAQLLSCNEQLIVIDHNGLRYEGCIVNGMCEHWEAFENLANKIAPLLPDIAGYVGIDLIVSDAGKQLTVVEVNPRLTTSYIALGEAIKANPAALIMQSYTEENAIWPNIEKNVVSLKMRQSHG